MPPPGRQPVLTPSPSFSLFPRNGKVGLPTRLTSFRWRSDCQSDLPPLGGGRIANPTCLVSVEVGLPIRLTSSRWRSDCQSDLPRLGGGRIANPTYLLSVEVGLPIRITSSRWRSDCQSDLPRLGGGRIANPTCLVSVEVGLPIRLTSSRWRSDCQSDLPRLGGGRITNPTYLLLAKGRERREAGKRGEVGRYISAYIPAVLSKVQFVSFVVGNHRTCNSTPNVFRKFGNLAPTRGPAGRSGQRVRHFRRARPFFPPQIRQRGRWPVIPLASVAASVAAAVAVIWSALLAAALSAVAAVAAAPRMARVKATSRV